MPLLNPGTDPYRQAGGRRQVQAQGQLSRWQKGESVPRSQCAVAQIPCKADRLVHTCYIHGKHGHRGESKQNKILASEHNTGC